MWIEQTKIGCHSNVASTIATQVHRNHLSLMTLHPQTLSSLASFKSGLVLPFWYRLTQDVLETFDGPLSGTTRVSRYQKGKTYLGFTGARDSE